ncbi:MAG: DUF429 domain-containing protein [Ignavibacteria bacterium]|nr:DUF429 domain-containing protein [Ignavibacteria bacterium]
MNICPSHLILGIDLAGLPKNPSGICLLDEVSVSFQIVFEDIQILSIIESLNPSLIAIDAPISLSDRICDKLMKKYGAMPLSLPSIFTLARRAVNLISSIKNICSAKVIEVFPTGTAKILGFYDKKFRVKLNKFEEYFGIRLPSKPNRHTFDAFLSCLTALLYANYLTTSVGDENGFIVIPSPEKKAHILELLTKRFYLFKDNI